MLLELLEILYSDVLLAVEFVLVIMKQKLCMEKLAISMVFLCILVQFTEVRITKVAKNYKTPLISYINEKGVRCWDDTEAAGKTIYMDNKIGLEGMQQFHGMEYEILAGYYYNDGFNPKVCEVN